MFNGILICFLFSLLLLLRFFHICIGYLSFFVKCLSFFPFFYWAMYICLIILVLLFWILFLCQLFMLQISSISVWLVSSPFYSVFFFFLWTQTLNSIFFPLCAFCVFVFNSSLPWGHKDILYYLLNWNFKVLPFTFWS